MKFTIAKKGKKLLLQFIVAVLFAILIAQFAAPIKAQSPPPAELVRVARQNYERGQFYDSAIALERAIKIYQKNRQQLETAKTLSLLSLVRQQLGEFSEAEKTLERSIFLLDRISASGDREDSIRAAILNRQGRFLLATGKVRDALDILQQAELLYSKTGDTVGVVGSKINQIQAYKALGFYRQVRRSHEQIKQTLISLPDAEIKVIGLLDLGNLLQQERKLSQSVVILSQALDLARKLDLKTAQSKLLLGLGNANRILTEKASNSGEIEAANKYSRQTLNYYQQAVATANSPSIRVQARLNWLTFSIENEKPIQINNLILSIANELESLPVGRSAIYARINFAQNLLAIAEKLSGKQIAQNIVKNLEIAIDESQRIRDPKAESYGLGTLGKWYEQNKNWQEATKLTKSALFLAQKHQLAEATYQWQWQMGRIIKANSQNSDITQAIAYYELALDTLQSLRGDLVALAPELQFSFQNSVEPVYRQFINLLLQSQSEQENLSKTIETLEQLEIVKLDNLFRDACVTFETVDLGNIDNNAAIIYPIVLENRLEIILKLPGSDNLRRYTQTNTTESDINLAVEQLQQSLSRRSTSPDRLKQEAAQLYDWLIKPLAEELEISLSRQQSQIKNLVFVLDSSLRNLPMSVLYDGNRYLVERYGIAISPGGRTLESPLFSRNDLKVLLAGASDSPSFQDRGLAPLNNVNRELSGIAATIQQTKTLEDREFRQTKLQQEINNNSFNVVHIATHGKFSSNFEDTYILDWNEEIGLSDLDRILEAEDPKKAKAIDLLVLSACETALGDRQAALGLAGVAVRSGANSTMASLWQVNDASTAQFAIEFYQQLNNPKLTKIEALRNTQLNFLANDSLETDYNRPYHWASFILVGNWL